MKSISVKYGFWIGAVLIGYFLLIRLVNLHEYVVLSAVNGLIFGLGIYYTIRAVQENASQRNYEVGFAAGITSGSVATVLLTVFMAIYMFQLDPEFPRAMMERWNMEESLSTSMLVIAILTMGAATTLVLTLTIMQLLKTSWNTKEGEKHTFR